MVPFWATGLNVTSRHNIDHIIFHSLEQPGVLLVIKAFCYKPFVPLYKKTILLVFDLVSPPWPNNVFVRWRKDKIPGLIIFKGPHFFSHSSFPILIRFGLIVRVWFHDFLDFWKTKADQKAKSIARLLSFEAGLTVLAYLKTYWINHFTVRAERDGFEILICYIKNRSWTCLSLSLVSASSQLLFPQALCYKGWKVQSPKPAIWKARGSFSDPLSAPGSAQSRELISKKKI